MPPSTPTIICFGDSLTAGFRNPTADDPLPGDAPYGRFLQHRLLGRATVGISGVCGERTAEMVERFGRDVVAPRPWLTVILGGTNDLGWGMPPRVIFRNLQAMYTQAAESGIQVTAVTVPSIRGADEYIPQRQELNALLLDYCTRHALSFVDLFTATAESETQRLARAYSNDGLHLTVAGYRLFADLLYQKVLDKGLSD
jgi:lysophospholipase L1-like esterase